MGAMATQIQFWYSIQRKVRIYNQLVHHLVSVRGNLAFLEVPPCPDCTYQWVLSQSTGTTYLGTNRTQSATVYGDYYAIVTNVLVVISITTITVDTINAAIPSVFPPIFCSGQLKH